jgi:hypothetical protein
VSGRDLLAGDVASSGSNTEIGLPTTSSVCLVRQAISVTVHLTIETARWRAGVDEIAASVEGLVPVVKGNRYGFGRARLARIAAELSDTIAVGTVHELGDVPAGITPVVLTPTLDLPPTDVAILTVGSREHVKALDGWGGRLIVRLVSSVRRYGQEPGDGLVAFSRDVGLDVAGVAIHPPLPSAEPEGDEGLHEHTLEVLDWLDEVDPDLPVSLSHVPLEDFAALPVSHEFRLRLGTSLWLGGRGALTLTADVLDCRPVRAGDTAGYRLAPVPVDGHLVMVGAGTANGVLPLPDGRSPFHFGRRRIPLHGPPHIHTSMLLVSDGDPLPAVGDRVDLDRPLTRTLVDRFEWV